jgi:hypothetical protein
VIAAVVEGRAKVVSAVPVGIPREAVVGTVEGLAELAGGMKWVGGEVVREVMKARPGREGRIGALGRMTLRVFSMGKEAVPEVIREVGMGGGEG